MAIALLPLKKGETLGSNFGRYAELMGLKSTWRLRRSLFGCDSEPQSRLPTAIDHLAKQACDYWNQGAEDIVKEHTEFQYATMMASQSVREKILQVMLASHAGEKFSCPLRIFGLKGERTATLRYCDGCLAEWIEKQQAPYWRIDHQLAGVYCCVKHACILKSVKRMRSERYFDQTVLRLINTSDERILQRVTPSEQRAIEDVAKRSGLQRAEGRICTSTKIYRDMLREAGFLHKNSHIKHDRMISAWFDYFGQEYCHVTGMTAGKISKWLDRLSEHSVRSECPHPFMFIAAESFLEHHVELPGSYLPQISCNARNFASEREAVGSVWEAYSCKGALHRSADVLEFTSMRRDRWKLVCTCGVSYRVRKTAQCDAAQLVPIGYGDRYRKRYRGLIAKGDTVWSAARKLHLSYCWAYSERVSNINSGELRKLHATWRRLVKNAPPERRITAAAEADPAVHKMLLKNDPDWLRTFNRSHRSPGRTKGAVRRKEPTSGQIREAWRELMSAEPPIMATRRAILERAGFLRAMGRNRSFEAVLVELVECRPAYLERVISWLANLASGQRLGDCDEALRTAGLRRSSFTREQRGRIRGIELTGAAEDHSARKC
ncbi:TnsD family Tn7-like transposition protein [Paraburkholderia sp. 32]|uniref:TnsD family Tn7-like transposition protein n=1 Tax=Paraburkholderia sp. 32 TaxID=2991057 RepID=UPI003D1C70D2